LRGVLQYGSRNLSTHSCECSPEEKAISLHEAVKEEITTVAKEAGFQDVSDDDIIELLESHSMPLMNEELAKVDSRHTKKHRMTR
jgi:hypothetical protein